MGGEHLKPVFGEATQKAMARRGCDLTLEESQHFARTLLDLIGKGLIVADSSGEPDVEVPGDPCPPREIGDSG
ncbi:MAG: hypothetical protein JXA57_18100 [Armatimonadetes bacterium]|nr:hypothetical protein [Armatimonadota bacterium]